MNIEGFLSMLSSTSNLGLEDPLGVISSSSAQSRSGSQQYEFRAFPTLLTAEILWSPSAAILLHNHLHCDSAFF